MKTPVKTYPIELLAWKRKLLRSNNINEINITKDPKGYLQIIIMLNEEQSDNMQELELYSFFAFNILGALPLDVYKIVSANFKFSAGVVILILTNNNYEK